jgi:hypothetical protein
MLEGSGGLGGGFLHIISILLFDLFYLLDSLIEIYGLIFLIFLSLFLIFAGEDNAEGRCERVDDVFFCDN